MRGEAWMRGKASELRRKNGCSHSVVGNNDATVEIDGWMMGRAYRQPSIV